MASLEDALQAVVDAAKAVADHTTQNANGYSPEGVEHLAAANRQMAEAIAWFTAPSNSH